MGLAVFFLLFVLIVGVAVVLLITGIILTVIGIGKKKKGGKETVRNIGIVMLAVPLLLILYTVVRSVSYNVMVKCVADEWRYKPFFMPRNVIEGSSDMLREILDSADDEDEDMIYREFSENVRNDRHFGDMVDDFLDDIDDLDTDLDPDDFHTDYGKNVHLESVHSIMAGYVYSAEIENRTYYCYVRICCTDDRDKDNVGLQQFIVCTEDKVDELYEIIEDGDLDLCLGVL